MYLIVTKSTVHHEGNERSRTHPGHGYPAYSETVEKVQTFDGYIKFIAEVKRLTVNLIPFEAYEAKKLSVEVETRIVVK
jgi:hypothetical protein